MNRRPLLALILLAGMLPIFGLLCVSCIGPTPRAVAVPLEIAGASYVGDHACFDCHSNICRVFPQSPHGRMRLEGAALAGDHGCEACHGPGSRHIAAGGGRGKFIINPGQAPEACLNCHLESASQFRLPAHHPVLEGKMNCVQCHDPHGLDIFKPASGLAMARINQGCAECHRDQARPFIFEHEAMREGCTNCHNPHGSVNAKMLVQRDSNLCLRCHAQAQGPGAGGVGALYIGNIDHTSYVRLGACWSAGCHTAVHGSNAHPRLFY